MFISQHLVYTYLKKKTFKEISHNFGGFDSSLLTIQPIWGAYWAPEIQEGWAWLATAVPVPSPV